ncbi:glycoside hydrolase family 11 protein, partial [Bacillus spizizenii]
YWSVRQTKRTSGTVSVSEHFKKWESLGMPMGKMYETALTVEGYQSNGSANVSTNVLTIGGKSK